MGSQQPVELQHPRTERCIGHVATMMLHVSTIPLQHSQLLASIFSKRPASPAMQLCKQQISKVMPCSCPAAVVLVPSLKQRVASSTHPCSICSSRARACSSCGHIRILAIHLHCRRQPSARSNQPLTAELHVALELLRKRLLCLPCLFTHCEGCCIALLKFSECCLDLAD